MHSIYNIIKYILAFNIDDGDEIQQQQDDGDAIQQEQEQMQQDIDLSIALSIQEQEDDDDNVSIEPMEQQIIPAPLPVPVPTPDPLSAMSLSDRVDGFYLSLCLEFVDWNKKQLIGTNYTNNEDVLILNAKGMKTLKQDCINSLYSLPLRKLHHWDKRIDHRSKLWYCSSYSMQTESKFLKLSVWLKETVGYSEKRGIYIIFTKEERTRFIYKYKWTPERQRLFD